MGVGNSREGREEEKVWVGYGGRGDGRRGK